jgi:hypothetical protein
VARRAQPSLLSAALFACALAPVLATPSAASATESEARGPDVTIIAGEERMVYEYRQAGQLRIIKVIPKHGLPYYLVPRDETRGFGDLERADMLIARWTLIEF